MLRVSEGRFNLSLKGGSEKTSRLSFSELFRRAGATHVSFDPCQDQIQDKKLFFRVQLSPRCNAVPLKQTFSATARGSVLCDKDRRAMHRRLPPIIGNGTGRKSVGNNATSLFPDHAVAFDLDVEPFLGIQMKAGSKGRSPKTGQCV